MTRALAPWQSRLLAVALLLAVLAALYGFAVQPLLAQHRAYDETIVDLRYRLAQYQRIARQGAALEQGLRDAKHQQATSSYYLKSAKPALASAELQQYVKERVTEGGGQLVSSQVMPEEKAEVSPSVAIRVHMRGSIGSLRAVLYGLETGSPVLFVDEVFVTQGPRRRLANGQAPEETPLDIRFRVTGYTRGGGA